VAAYADDRRRNPIRIELRDGAEQVQMAADYEYELDAHAGLYFGILL